MNYLESKMASTSLFRTEFPDSQYVVWSPLPWDQFKKFRDARHLLGNKVDLAIDESVYNKCVLFSSFDVESPDKLSEADQLVWREDCRNEQPAGVISTVVRAILKRSGSMSAEEVIAGIGQYREVVGNIEDQIIALICQAFPAYTPEQVESLDWSVILKRAAQAEVILGVPIELYDPEAERLEQIRQQKFSLEKEIAEVAGMMQPTPQMERLEMKDHEIQRREMQKTLRDEYMSRRGR